MLDLQKSWQERLDEETSAAQKRIYELQAEERRRETTPFLWNLNEDPSLCGKITHFIAGGNHESLNMFVKPHRCVYAWLTERRVGIRKADLSRC